MISIHRSSLDSVEDEEELRVHMRSHKSPSRSPGRTEKRSMSHTVTVYSSIDNDSSNDIENIGTSPRPKMPGAMKTGNGSSTLGKVRSNPKRAESYRGPEGAGVRKTSGRVGSVSLSARKISGL